MQQRLKTTLIALEEAVRIMCVCIGGRICHIQNSRSVRAEKWDPSLRRRQTWAGWGDAGDGQWGPPGTVSCGVRQRDSPRWEPNGASALKRPFLSSPEASLLSLLVPDLFFHVR